MNQSRHPDLHHLKTQFKQLSVFTLFFLALTVFTACEEEQKPENLLPERVFINLIAEVEVLETYRNQAEDTVSVAILRDSVFTHYDATEQQFYRTEAYYQQRPEKYKALLDSALERLNIAQARITGIEYKKK